MLVKLTPARAIAVQMARDYLNMSPEAQRAFFGSDYQKSLDKLAVMVAAYDYAVATRSEMRTPKLVGLPSPVALLDVPDADSWLADVAPPIEFVLQQRVALMALDIDSLDPMDAVDVLKELQWADFWYDWYARQFDA